MTTFATKAKSENCSLFEAVASYINENDLDADELMSVLDPQAKLMIQTSAIENNFVRKCVRAPTTQLVFD